jgi:hypothetical protein
MGQAQSSNNNKLPSGKSYNISYCQQWDILKEKKFPEYIDLSNLLEGSLLLSVFKYKMSNMGYSMGKVFYPINVPLNEIINFISLKLKPYKIKSRCYIVSLDNIKYLLSEFNVLIAGIIVDQEFAKNILNTEITQTVTDIILITGYHDSCVTIKTNWTSDLIDIPIDYLCNIKEIWNIEVLPLEDKYLELLSECSN